MLNSNENRFSNLLKMNNSTKYDNIKNEAEVEKSYEKIMSEYYNIQCDILDKKESLMIVSSILSAYHSNNNRKEYFNDDMEFLIDLTIDAVDLLSYEILEKSIPFNVERGKWFFERGRYNKALDAWEEVLKLNPDNEYIHARLDEMITKYD